MLSSVLTSELQVVFFFFLSAVQVSVDMTEFEDVPSNSCHMDLGTIKKGQKVMTDCNQIFCSFHFLCSFC